MLLQSVLPSFAAAYALGAHDPAAVICHAVSAGGGAPSDDGADPSGTRQGGGHCALCAISPPVPPQRADLDRPMLYDVRPAAPPAAAARVVHDIHGRPGKPRDPPPAS